MIEMLVKMFLPEIPKHLPKIEKIISDSNLSFFVKKENEKIYVYGLKTGSKYLINNESVSGEKEALEFKIELSKFVEKIIKEI